jgi:hypothetical protein
LIVKPIPIVVLSTFYVRVNKVPQLFVYGEIKNVIDLPIANIVLHTKVLKDDVIVRDLLHTPILFTTLPGQHNLYSLNPQLGLDSNGLQGIRVETEVLTTTVETFQQTRNLAIQKISTGLLENPLIPGTTVTVTIRNDTPQPVQNINILIWASYPLSNSIYPCSPERCGDGNAVTMLLPGQLYTTTLTWQQVGDYGFVIPTSAINVVAQGTLSP